MEESEQNTLLNKALGVYEDVSGYNPEESPSNGFEYLHQVICENSKLPQTIVADINPDKFLLNQTYYVEEGKKCPFKADLLPTQEWQQVQVRNFTTLRSKIDSMKQLWNLKKPKLNTTISLPPDIDSEEAWLEFCSQSPPLMQVLLSVQQPGIIKLLSYFSGWLAEESMRFNENTTQWLYSLFACLEEPLWPSTFADLRDILRRAREYRSNIESVDDALLNPLNLIICVGSRHFRQTDLCD